MARRRVVASFMGWGNVKGEGVFRWDLSGVDRGSSLKAMKPRRVMILLAMLGVGVAVVIGQVASPKGGVAGRLEQALKLYPEADEDGDGVLSIQEALAYVKAHPEAGAKLQAKAKGGSKGTSKPASFAPGVEGTKVFVCAHSYMIYTADWLPEIAELAGVSHLKAGQQMIGGSRVTQHWEMPEEKNQAKKALREGIVDVLTLAPHLQLPDEGIENFTRLGLEKNPNLRVLVQASWVPMDGKEGPFVNAMRDAVTAEELRRMRELQHGSWLKALEAQVEGLNGSLGRQVVRILPVSGAVYALRERIVEGKVPGVAKQSELFRDDHGHPSDVLAALVTYCHFAAIYRQSPVGLPVPEKLKGRPEAEALNRVIQEIAWEAVKGYRLSGVTIEAE